MKNLIYIISVLIAAVSATAWDYLEIGYERIANEDYDFSVWMPPGYDLDEEEIAEIIFEGKTFLYEWSEGEYEGLMVAIMVVDRRNGLIDLDMLKEANEKYFELADFEKITEASLDPKSLDQYDASHGFSVTAQYGNKKDDGRLYDYSVLYLQKGVNLYVISLACPAENAEKQSEALSRIRMGFRCSAEESELVTSPAAGRDDPETSYERVVNEEGDFALWLPPDYETNVRDSQGRNGYEYEVIYEWEKHTGSYFAGNAFRVIVAGLTDRTLGDFKGEFEGSDPSIEDAIETVEWELIPKALRQYNADQDEAYRYIYDDGRDHLDIVMYLKSGKKAYVVEASYRKDGGMKVKETAQKIINGFRIGTEEGI